MVSTTKKVIIIAIIILVLLNIKYEFITSKDLDILKRIKLNALVPSVINNTTHEIGTIEEESLQRINKLYGGLDDINATGAAENINRPRIHEGFSNNIYELQLFYKITCGHSQQFLPIWYELTSALPKLPSITFREFNCDAMNANGISICSSPYNITGVPTIKLKVITPDGVESTHEYSGPRTYKNINTWLASKGLQLMFNADMATNTEGFVNVSDMGTDVSNKIITADGNIRKAYSQEWANAAAMNEFGEFHDVQDGCYIASFSKCKEGTPSPGYQIFTHRGQYGCVYPEPGTGISSDFDAAFTVADQYLSTCVPPKYDPETGNEINLTPAEKKSQMMKCAMKYRNQLRSFGLCDETKLNEKYVIPEHIRQGKLKVPLDDMSADDYQSAADSAEAIYTACSV